MKTKSIIIGFIIAVITVPFIASMVVVRAQCSDSWFSKLLGVSESCGNASRQTTGTGEVSFTDASGKQVKIDVSSLADFVAEQKANGMSNFELSTDGTMLTVKGENGESRSLDISKLSDTSAATVTGTVLSLPGGVTVDMAQMLGLADYYAGTGVMVSGSRVIATTLGTSISTAELEAGAVISNRIAEGAVVTDRIADGAVVTSKISDNAVVNSKIADGTIKFSKLNDNECQGGQVIKYSGTNWTCGTGIAVGDIKTGMQVVDHGGWVKLDGRLLADLSTSQRVAAEALGLTNNLPDADSAFLVQNGENVGSVTGSNQRTIARAQLPNTTLGGATSSNGNHTHAYTSPTLGAWDGSNVAPAAGQSTDYKQFPNANGASTSAAGAHTHTITTDSLNGGVTQQQLSVTPRSLSVTMFIYLGL